MEKKFININYEQSEKAKRAGVKWDWVKKSWYFDNFIPPGFTTKGPSFEERLAQAKRKHQESKLCKA